MKGKKERKRKRKTRVRKMFVKIKVKAKNWGSQSQTFCLTHLPPFSQTKEEMDLDSEGRKILYSITWGCWGQPWVLCAQRCSYYSRIFKDKRHLTGHLNTPHPPQVPRQRNLSADSFPRALSLFRDGNPQSVFAFRADFPQGRTRLARQPESWDNC